MSHRFLLVALVLAAGCYTSPAPSTPAPTAATPAASATPAAGEPPGPAPTLPSGDLLADGTSCLEAAECASGVCEGQGCGPDAPGTCAPKARGCTRDMRAYCGCDGVTFNTSGSCPGRRFSARDACH